MARIHDLKQERAQVTESIRNLMDKHAGTTMTAEDEGSLRKMEARFDELQTQINSEERQLERERLAGEHPEQERPRDETRARQREAFLAHLREGGQETLRAYNALQQDDPAQAGYLVPPEEFVRQLIAEVDDAQIFRGLCKKMTLSGAQSMGFPKRTARMNTAAWGTELSTPTPDTSLAFGKREFKPNPATGEILISRTLIRNAPGVDGIVRAEMAYNFAELLENAYMTGDGAGKPLGIFTASADGISAARDVSTGNSSTAMTFDGLIEAKYAIKQPYQTRLKWIFHRDGIKNLAKIKDSDGQYIWQPSVVEGTPDRLMGRPVLMSEYVPHTFTAGQYVGMIGDFSNYWIVDSMHLTMQVLTELYARSNQVDYIAHLETDGMPVLEECFSRIKLAAS